MESSEQKRRFPPPWRVKRFENDRFDVVDSNGIRLASVPFFPNLDRVFRGSSHLTETEAKRIANAIARLPEFLMPRRGFYPRGSGPHWKASRPYHVGVDELYSRTHWDWMNALCKHNGIPMNTTGQVIGNGPHWRVYEFEWQLDAMQFWDAFEGRWLRGTEFHFPERPTDFPSLKPLENWRKFDPRKARN